MSESKRFYLAAGLFAFVFVLIAMTAGVWVYAEHRLADEWRQQAAQHQALADSATQHLAAQNQILNDLRQDALRQRASLDTLAAELRNELATQRTLIDGVRIAPVPNAVVADPQPIVTHPRVPYTGFQPRRQARQDLIKEDGRLPRRRAWGPEQAVGAPDTEGAGDATTAWASLTQDGQPEWLILDYAEAVNISKVKVYENYCPGALVRVTTFDEAGNEVEGWAGKDPTPIGALKGISEVAFAAPRKSKRVKIYLDSVNVPGWNEIDAVGIVDDAEKIHWAVSASASSTYADINGMREPVELGGLEPFGGGPVPQQAPLKGRAWGPEQATGEPNTLIAGDQQTAWASRTQDGQPEWLILEYAEAVNITRVKVYETYNPGALNKVSVFGDDGKEIEVWTGKDPTPMTAAKGVSEIVLATPRKSKKIKIYLDSVNVPGWNEIDAVGIVDDAQKTHWAVDAKASSTYAEQGDAFVPVRPQADVDPGQF